MRVLCLLLLIGCGDNLGTNRPTDARTTDGDPTSDGGIDAPVDAAEMASTVMQVTPCNNPVIDATVTTVGNAYMPAMTTITVNQVVRFNLDASHDVAPLPGTDPNLVVPLGGDRCYRFTTAGVARFKCTPHGFTGMITVN